MGVYTVTFDRDATHFPIHFPNHFRFNDSADSPVGGYSPVGVYTVTFTRDGDSYSDSYLNRVRPVRSSLVTSSHFTFAYDKMKRHEIILNSQLSCFVDISLVPGPARSRAVPDGPGVYGPHKFSASISATHPSQL